MNNIFFGDYKKNICVLKIRGTDTYFHPLQGVMSPFYYVLKDFIKKHPEYSWNFNGVNFFNKKRRDIETIKNCDIFIIPTHNEFRHHKKRLVSKFQIVHGLELIETLSPYLKNKKVILLSQDILDDIELFKEYTFNGLNIDYSIISENEFKNSIQTIKYHLMKQHICKDDKEYSFGYWGHVKKNDAYGNPTNDVRHHIIKDIVKNISDHFIIGTIVNNYQMKTEDDFRILMPILNKMKTTLCFTLNDEHITARYLEALGANVIPYVWKKYDCNNTMGILPEQRITSSDEMINNIMNLNNNEKYRIDFLNAIDSNLRLNIPDISYYVDTFEEKLLKILK